jgi:hypothetical protein
MADDGGVLGNLPRSRPGHRSEKRTGSRAAKAGAAGTAEAGAGTAGRPRQPAAAPNRSARPRPSTAPPPPQPGSSAGDPVGDAIRTVTGVAATGARVAGGVAREVLRRLPRP